MIGKTLGHYEILEPLGAGGMGEVYRARDTTLDREVAIKVLPAEMAADQERLERFRREALTVAALNHPNIVTIYSVERENDVDFITLEYVDGRTLDHIVGPGGLPIDTFFEVAIPLTDAIAAAHERGIAHRDLKPGNVMVSAEGRVKVLDFGLAKLLEAATDADAATQLASAQHLTEEGKVLGTVAYMSPEQAEGKEIDHRSDVFSLGILLYEMATGDRPFTGDTKLSVLSSIVRDEPTSITELNTKLPRHLGRIVKKALEKDPKRRYQTVLDVRNDLAELKGEIDSGEMLVTGTFTADSAALSGGGRSRWTTCALAAGAVIGVLSIGQFLYSTIGGDGVSGAPAEAAPAVNVVPLTSSAEMDVGATLSPDGEWFAFSRFEDEGPNIYLQSVGSRNALQITNGIAAYAPAFSPDGTRIAFAAGPAGGIHTMTRTGDRLRQLTDHGSNPAWSPDGTKIVFGNELVLTRPYVRNAVRDHLGIVDVESGTITEIPVPDGVQPHWSPNGERIAYWASTGGQRDIWTIPAAGGEPVSVTQDVYHDYSPTWSPDGEWLYFASDRSGSMAIWRVRVDLSSGEPRGEPQQITTGGSGTPGLLSFAADGRRLVYTESQIRSKVLAAPFDLAEASIGDDAETLVEGARLLAEVTVSADGRWLAFRDEGPSQDVFVVSADGGEELQVTEGVAKDWYPALSPDGERVAYYSNASGNYEIWVADRDGSNPLRLTDDPEGSSGWQPRWSPDGETIAYYRVGKGTFLVDADTPWDQQDEVAIPNQPGVEAFFRASDWSADGRRLLGWQGSIRTYDLETGEYTVLFQESGGFPRWTTDGRILVGYAGPSRIVDPETGDSVAVSGPAFPGYLALSPDNTRAYYVDFTAEAHIWLLEIQEGR